LLGCGAVGGFGLTAGVLERLKSGIRLPLPQGEPRAKPQRLSLMDPPIKLSLTGAYIQAAERMGDGLALELRAWAPQPQIDIECARSVELDILFRNLSPLAKLEGSGARINETAETTINRRLVIKHAAGASRHHWSVPFTDEFLYTAIGDSGGGSEFAWCLERSKQLGAHFMLHLGDIYYSDDDIVSTATNLDNAPLPMYTSIGNHDFQRDGVNLHEHFRQQIGPRNTFFRLGDSMVVNFDTAASIWPADAGERNQLFDRVEASAQGVKNWIFMTHRPLHDERATRQEGDGHVLSPREHEYVIARLKRLTRKPWLLCGHIHISGLHVADGISTYVSGEGLATRNIVAREDEARILVGEVAPGYGTVYRWKSLLMPKTAHCHYKAEATRREMGITSGSSEYGESCG